MQEVIKYASGPWAALLILCLAMYVHCLHLPDPKHSKGWLIGAIVLLSMGVTYMGAGTLSFLLGGAGWRQH